MKNDTRERERENKTAGLEMPARTKNGSKHWRCDRLTNYECTMNSARTNNSSARYHTRIMEVKNNSKNISTDLVFSDVIVCQEVSLRGDKS